MTSTRPPTPWHRFIHPVTGYFRKRRSAYLQALFPDLARLKICDLGGSRHFWEKLGLDIPKENIVIYNISSDETESAGGGYGQIEVRLYDGTRVPVADGHYDLVICNSVIEHVPPAQRKAFATEALRIGKRFFCQTPAASFPVEPHFVMPFLHWLPRSWGYRLAHVSPWRFLARPSKAVLDSYFWGTRLLGEKEFRALFDGCEIGYERWLGLVKSLYAIRK